MLWLQSLRYDREGDTTLFSFWDFYLFELISVFVYQWLPNGLKPRRVSDFVIDCFWNCQESEGRETKKHDLGTIYFIFKFFKLLRIRKKVLVST